MPRDLKELDGWRFSSLRNILLEERGTGGRRVSPRCTLRVGMRDAGFNIYHPAARERVLDSKSGVSIHGCFGDMADIGGLRGSI